MKSQKELMVIAVQDLIICRQNIFDNIVNLALAGELSHLADAVDIGEKYEFKLNHFRGLKDNNVNALIQICELIEGQIPVLMDENDIDITELNFNI